MSVADIIRRKLEEALSPERLEIVDESRIFTRAMPDIARKGNPFPGHGRGWPSSVSRSRVERQRLITSALKDEMGNPIHALSMEALAPDEADGRSA